MLAAEYKRYQDMLLTLRIQKLKRKGQTYSSISKICRVSISRAQSLFASYDLISLMRPKNNYFSTKQEVERIIEDCIDCLAFGETKYAKQNGYFRDFNNLRNSLQGEEKGLGKTLTEKDIDYIINKVKELWSLEKQKRVAEYEKAFELKGLYNETT